MTDFEDIWGDIEPYIVDIIISLREIAKRPDLNTEPIQL